MKRIEEHSLSDIARPRALKKAREKVGEFSALLHELDGLLERLIEVLEEERKAAAKGVTPKQRG
jgi:hypothetical protein